MILFVVFFSIGAASLSISILCDDLVRYYRTKRQLMVTQQDNKKIKSISADYDVVIEKWEKDPNRQAKRLAPATLGAEPEDPNTVYPRATPEEIAAARQTLETDPNDLFDTPALPKWLIRSSEPRRRITLFIAGSFLILISFTCFTPPRQSKVKE